MVEDADDGQYLFKSGDINPDLFYLLKGSVNLQLETLKIETIKAGSESARFALAHQIPRKVNVIASGRIRFLRLNADMMKSIQSIPYEESESNMIDDELEENDDWMTTLLKSPIFRMLPPANLQKILMSLQEIRFKAGEIIINQGDQGDCYYIIKKGQCLISRKPAPNAKEIRLGQLTDLDAFGEDALISGQPRNVTITAATDVSLLRLGKEQFLSLIKQPTMKYIGYPEAQELIAAGAELIDVREPDEYRKHHLPHSVNVPFFSLRMQLKTINRQNPIVVVCKDGKTSETASFILLRHKFNALVLQGGMDCLSQDLLKAPASFTIDDGIEIGNYTGKANYGIETSPLPAAPTIQDDAQQMRQIIQNLKSRCTALEAEKKALEQQCATLATQVQSLKAELKAK